MTLQNLQAEFAESILSDEADLAPVLPAQNLAIYSNNMTANLINTLQDTYPLIAKIVGHDFFRLTAKEYMQRYPSRSNNLHDYGEYFSDFLAQYQPVKTLIYLPEVAQFEWLCHILFFAADHAPLHPASLEAISPEQYKQLHFTLHPASRLMKCHYPLLRIIDLCQGEIDEIINLHEGGQPLLIIRRDLDISLVTLTLAEFHFLNALNENQTLSEALDIAISIDPDFKLEEKLPAWIKDKTLVDCRLADHVE